MAHPTLSPASSIGGLASLGHFSHMAGCASHPRAFLEPGKVRSIYATDQGRNCIAQSAESMSVYKELQEQSPSPLPGLWRPKLPADDGHGIGKPQIGDHHEYTHPPYTPEMSPQASAVYDEAIFAHNRRKASKITCSDKAHAAKKAWVEKKRKPPKSHVQPGPPSPSHSASR